MQSLFYGAAAASVAGLLLGAGFKADPQPAAQPQQEAVYEQDAGSAANDGFQPAYLQGAVYTPASYAWASDDHLPPVSSDAYPEPKLEKVSYAEDPPHGDDIPTPAEPAAAPAIAPSSTSPAPSTTPASAQPGAPGQREDDQNAPASRASSAQPAAGPVRPAPTPAPPPGAPQSTPPQGPQSGD